MDVRIEFESEWMHNDTLELEVNKERLMSFAYYSVLAKPDAANIRIRMPCPSHPQVPQATQPLPAAAHTTAPQRT